MDRSAIDALAQYMADARLAGRLLSTMPNGIMPRTVADAHAVQDALADRLGETVAGWKISGIDPTDAKRGAILGSRIFKSGARLPASQFSMLGLEAEIAFRFERDLPVRDIAYSYEEGEAAVTAFPAFEVVDTRFADYAGTPPLHRLCDFGSNGGLVCGTPNPDWRKFDFTSIGVVLTSDGEVLVDAAGGHPNRDPLLPAVALIEQLRGGAGVRAGQVVTTGSFTGMRIMEVGKTIRATFKEFGSIEVRFED